MTLLIPFGLGNQLSFSEALMKRIRNNYRIIVGVNSGLIGLGVIGVIQLTDLFRESTM